MLSAAGGVGASSAVGSLGWLLGACGVWVLGVSSGVTRWSVFSRLGGGACMVQGILNVHPICCSHTCKCTQDGAFARARAMGYLLTFKANCSDRVVQKNESELIKEH